MTDTLKIKYLTHGSTPSQCPAICVFRFCCCLLHIFTRNKQEGPTYLYGFWLLLICTNITYLPRYTYM